MVRSGLNDKTQLLKVNELKVCISEVVHPKFDHIFNYLRWLEHYNFDVKKTATALREHLRLRARLGLDEMCAEELEAAVPRAFRERCPSGLHPELIGRGIHRHHHLLICYFNRHYTPKKALNGLSHMAFFTSQIYDWESQLAAVSRYERASGHRSGLLKIIDLEGTHVDLAGVQALAATLAYYYRHYPGLDAKVLLVNPSAVLHRIWTLTRHLFPARVLANLDFCGINELNSYVDVCRLPAQLGGGLLGPGGDRLCAHLFHVPREHPAAHDSPTAWHPHGPLENKISVRRGGCGWAFVRVAEGESFEWAYQTSAWHSFGLYYSPTPLSAEPAVEEMELVRPQLPFFLPAHFIQTDSISHPRPGFYALRFGNEGALVASLHVAYTLRTRSLKLILQTTDR